jgi:PilZ domain
MTADMAFECLLVSQDSSLISTMNRLLGNLSISSNICLSSSKAIVQLSAGSPDLVIVDWGEDSAALLHKIQESGKWHKPIVVAVLSRDYPLPGAHIMLRKPVTEASGAMTLKAAYYRMLYDYRRHARYALLSSVQATNENHRVMDVTITDIGDGGVGLSSREDFVIGEVLRFRLLLPGAERLIYIEARVRWARNYGGAGCEYVRIPPVDHNILHDWLKSKAPVKKPLIEI